MKKTILPIIISITTISITAMFLTSCKEEEELNLFFWSSPINDSSFISDDVIEDFEKETGINVNYKTFANNSELIEAINAGEKFDLITPNNNKTKYLIENDMLEELDYSKLPNSANILNVLKEASFDIGSKYSMPFNWGTFGIIYNKKYMETPTTWDVLFDDTYANKILMYNAPRETIGIVLKRLGYDINSTNAEQLEEVKDILLEQKPLVHKYVTSDIIDLMVNEKAYVAGGFSGEATEIALQNENIGYSIPREGSNFWITSLAIPKDAENIDNAHKFIDYLCRPEVAKELTMYNKFTTANASALKLLSEDIIDAEGYYVNLYDINMDLIEEVGDFIHVYNDIIDVIIYGEE